MFNKLKIKRTLGNSRGFTLIEVVVAMACFMVIALATFKMTIRGWQSTEFSQSKTEAAVMASQHIEMLFSEKYASDQAAGMSQRVVSGTHNFSDNGYDITYTVTDDALLPDSKFIQMTVRPEHASSTKGAVYNYLIPMRK